VTSQGCVGWSWIFTTLSLVGRNARRRSMSPRPPRVPAGSSRATGGRGREKSRDLESGDLGREQGGGSDVCGEQGARGWWQVGRSELGPATATVRGEKGGKRR
jgi:hypothetical protein